MKNKNLNFSPKKLQTSLGSPQMMTNTTINNHFYFGFFLICGNLRRFVAFPYKLLNVADVIIMHSVKKTV